MSEFISVLQLLESRVAAYPDQAIIGIPEADLTYRTCTYSELDNASSRLALYFVSSGLIPSRPDGDVKDIMSVAMLAPSSFEYAMTEIALLKMGYTVVFLSILNSIPALVHLLKSTSAKYILAHSSQEEPAREAVRIAQAEGFDCTLVMQPPRSAWDSQEVVQIINRLTHEEASPTPAFVIHSSGSTGFPKPIFIKHKAACDNWIKNFNTKGFITLPLYHAHGLNCFYRAIQSNKILYMYPPDIPLTTHNLKRVLEKTPPDVEGFYAVPYVLKLLGDSEEGIRLLKRFKLVTFAGSPCPDGLGDKLARDNDIHLVAHYGSTEMGQLMTSMRDFDNDKDWNYVRAAGPGSQGVKDFLRFDHVADGVYELVVLDGWPSKVMSNQPDGSYATKDLFIKHPTTPDAYRYIGRLDDTLVMVNGEKTNPIPMEGTIKAESKYINEVIVFGAGRPQTGALLIPSELGNNLSPNELLPLIWPAIESANASAPAHSRLLPEMLVFLPYGTPLPRTDKGTFVRARTYTSFAGEIEDAYKRFEDGESVSKTEKKQIESRDEMVKFVKETVMLAFGPKKAVIREDEDLFVYGVDSLQAARIRQIFQRDLDLNSVKLPFNFVFENPSVNRLADYLLAVQSGRSADDDSKGRQDRQKALMKDLVSKYSNFTEVPKRAEVVLLTGATGSLGAHLLNALMGDESVHTVYCLCRAKDDDDARTRVNESLRIRGLTSLDERQGLTQQVICLRARLGEEDLGLSRVSFEELQAKVSVIIHNAWAVNFNMGVESFEAEHIRAVYNLLNLAISARHGTPASFYFSSSVSAVAAAKGDVVHEKVSTDAADAQDMGYARSKWVAEQLSEHAYRTRGIRIGVFRIGQLVADTANGIWNDTEAIPLQIKAAKTIGALPDLDESVNWLPVDIAAKACIEIALHPNVGLDPATGIVWHIVNTHSTSWREIHEHLRAAGLQFDVVPRREWIQRLRESDHDPLKNPTIKLLEFFESKYDKDAVIKRAELSTKYTSVTSRAIEGARPIEAGFVEKFVRAWQKTGFL